MSDIDLHIHSLFSDDGEHSVDTLMTMAEQAGLKVAAIADHDSVKASLAMRKSKRETSVRWIDAIEISCRHKQKDYHLLGYFIDPFDRTFEMLENNMRNNELAVTERRLKLLAEHLGIDLPLTTLQEYAGDKILTGEKICAWLLENEENRKHPELIAYFPHGSRSDNPLVNFYWDYLSQGKVAYVPLLAHPGKNVFEEHAILDELVGLGLDGLEAFSSYHNEIQIAFYAAYAKRHTLILTCGSDYHGKSKPRIKMGMTHCPLTSEEIMLNLERGRK
jgi:predicted metal-dependent phosphoesterase TrpH